MGARKPYSGNLEKSRRKRVKTKFLPETEVIDPQETEKDPLSNVVYLGHIPHGFYQPQITAYFQQFGKVMRVRLSKSKKTLRSRGYAFVQFEDKVVAKIAAETMNNYLTFERLMKCHQIPESKVHPKMFKNCYAEMKPYRKPIQARERHNSHKGLVALTRINSTARAKLSKMQSKLAGMGINFNIDLVMKPAGPTDSGNVTLPTNDATPASVPATPKAEAGAATENFIIPFENYMLVDSSDDEITFKTPPSNVKVLRKKTQSKAIVGC